MARNTFICWATRKYFFLLKSKIIRKRDLAQLRNDCFKTMHNLNMQLYILHNFCLVVMLGTESAYYVLWKYNLVAIGRSTSPPSPAWPAAAAAPHNSLASPPCSQNRAPTYFTATSFTFSFLPSALSSLSLSVSLLSAPLWPKG